MASSLVLLMTQVQALDDSLSGHRENPQLWFPTSRPTCSSPGEYSPPCAMRLVCLAGAVERHEPHGVWGGEIFARGAIITEKRPRGRPKKQDR